jgi:hypothetical protein
MERNKKMGILINGTIFDVGMSHDNFIHELIEWVESKGFSWFPIFIKLDHLSLEFYSECSSLSHFSVSP